MATVRPPAEVRYADELAAIAANDPHPKPPGWRLSPRAVRTFILGSSGEALSYKQGRKTHQTVITQKFYGDDALVDRCVVTLAGNRGLMLVGEPGTAKSMLSELFCAAVSGNSTLTIQGTAGTTEDQIKYSWNYALLIAEGPSSKALVPSPLYVGLSGGQLVRFEEITRCPPEIQDSLVSVLSDKVLMIPELDGDDRVLLAQKGFNVIATANIRDRGVNEMSSALKRRFNFETVHPIVNLELERQLVLNQAQALLAESDVPIAIAPDIVELLVSTFHDLRSGRTSEGIVVERPTTVMSTAEAVAVSVSAGLDAYYLDDGIVTSEHIVRNLVGTVLKDNPEDAKKLAHYFNVVVKNRAQNSPDWEAYYKARKLLK
ncbi:AAA family ATPase [Nodosilinea sp. LEGE 07088]|uniref:ATP-binding protein n=1 Tax=Nodosilinea sp. LEGE 07088 TaxID=2777968 RepID=UPI00187FD02A|nr:AAA family ATPase [Nodosilinea sp. LEGE 07088]MBE9140258.1 AAA family ATPase [Nodosilinea sp. LEGE 07088]